MKKLEELKSMSSFKKESDDFLRKVVGGDSVEVINYTTTVNGSCYSDNRAVTHYDNDPSEWDGKARQGDPIDCPKTL